MVVPYPFSKAIFLYGEPLVVPRDANVEELRLKVERVMNDLADRAERDFDSLYGGKTASHSAVDA